MRKPTKFVIAGVAVAAVIGAGAGIGVAISGDDDETDVPITGAALDRAIDAALAYVGEGRVTETEVGDEEGAYEVEVTLDDGRQVDVHLDEAFNVLGTEADEELDEPGE